MNPSLLTAIASILSNERKSVPKRNSWAVRNPKLVKAIRNARFLHPELTDASLSEIFNVSVPTIRKYVDDLSTSRRHVARMVDMRTGATFAVA